MCAATCTSTARLIAGYAFQASRTPRFYASAAAEPLSGASIRQGARGALSAGTTCLWGVAEMVQKSPIEWCTHTSNPIKFRDRATGKSVWGCIRRSPGCAHCYSADLAKRYGRGGDFTAEELAGYECYIDDEELKSLLSVRRIPAGSKCFVGDMTDVFGEWVPFEFLDRLFAVFALRPDVVFQLLTKRPERMREYFERGNSPLESRAMDVLREAQHQGDCVFDGRGSDRSQYWGASAGISDAELARRRPWPGWPLPNVWLGTSVENQHWADIRIPELLATPAAVRFLSCEPLLGPLELERQLHDSDCWMRHLRYGGDMADFCSCNEPREDHIAWVIVGGESGPGARPFDLAWARSIVSQCRAAGVAVFVKQTDTWQETVWAIHNRVVKAWPVGSPEDQRFIALALVGEAGEMANLVKKDWRGDRPLDAEFAEELADIRIYLELLARVSGIDLDTACAAKIPELLRRWPGD
ncbi:MAG: DUF5131 family protein [Desulfurellales bacterium]|nr:MAG: DUF5131 family protein [Desulfurellales bacterium]